MSRNVNFYQAVDTSKQVTIFVPPAEFEIPTPGATLDADLYATDAVLLIRIRALGEYIATSLDHREALLSGKPVCIAHLHPRLGYVHEQCRLNIHALGEVEDPERSETRKNESYRKTSSG